MNQAPGSRTSAPCFHGGAFFEAVGPRFDDLSRSERVVNADVLDAWFPPAPQALQALRDHLPWLIRTSPPTDCGGFLEVVAETRGVPVECLLPGGGSSDLMFLALPRWLDAGSRVTLLDPTYGEYRHILDHVVGCQVDALPLRHKDGYRVDLGALAASAAESDLLILVNPNSPTGLHVPREQLLQLLDAVPRTTRVWIDETYVEYVSAEQSLEQDVVRRPNAVVCKSMSKVYALSGARAAYLCGSEALLAPLRRFVPPWAVSLPAQVAAVAALQSPDYYAARYGETHALRDDLLGALASLSGVDVLPGCANFLLCHLDDDHPTAAQVVGRCREQGVFLRDAQAMGRQMGPRVLRTAVKGADDNARIVAAVEDALSG